MLLNRKRQNSTFFTAFKFDFNTNLRRYAVAPGFIASDMTAELGRALQVDPMKAPGFKRLKLEYDKLLSILLQFCFQLQLATLQLGPELEAKILTSIPLGRYGQPDAGRCRTTRLNPR